MIKDIDIAVNMVWLRGASSYEGKDVGKDMKAITAKFGITLGEVKYTEEGGEYEININLYGVRQSTLMIADNLEDLKSSLIVDIKKWLRKKYNSPVNALRNEYKLRLLVTISEGKLEAKTSDL